MEHRRYHRLTLNLAAQLQLHDTHGVSYPCQLRDIGHQGVGIIIEGTELSTGTVVEINIPFTTQLGSGKRNFTAHVVHSNGNKLGLEWLRGNKLGGLVNKSTRQAFANSANDTSAAHNQINFLHF